MRTLALAAIVGVAGLAFGGVAAAQPYADPNGRITFDKPAGWTVSVEHSADFSYIIAGNANNECQFVAQPNSHSANANPWDVRRTGGEDTQFQESNWLALANSVRPIFPGNSARFVSRSLDSSSYWPVQRAELQSPDRVVHAGMQTRPGMDLIGFCMTYGGDDPVATYDAVLRSMGHPGDDALQAAITAHDNARAAQAAQPAAPAPAQAAAPPAVEHGVNGHDRREGPTLHPN